LSNNSVISSWNPKVHYRAHKIPAPDPILSPHRSLTEVHLNTILPPTPRSSQFSSLLGIWLIWVWCFN